MYKEYLEADIYRMGGVNRKGYTYYLLKLFRKAQYVKGFRGKVYRTLYKIISLQNAIEIPPLCKIGKGFSIYHPFNITINPSTIIGDNCDIHKGVLIGEENRGKRKGCPIIGDSVWIGANAVIVGKITIGNDVLIAPNAFVNTDIPSHSIVYGNPCVIKHCEKATEHYINRLWQTKS